MKSDANGGMQNFNPRSREGSDCISALDNLRTLYDFNPRSREGSDRTKTEMEKAIDISIHAPAKGATRI